MFDISLESLLDEGKEKNNRDTKKCTNFLFIFLFFISVLFMCFQIDILYLIIINLVVSVGKLVLIVIKKGKIKFVTKGEPCDKILKPHIVGFVSCALKTHALRSETVNIR